jgi:ABC-type Fe3+-siderophore transport system permease subunit
VFALAYRRGFSALSLILGGMIVGMATGSINAVVTLFHFESLHSVFLWNTGVVRQNDWAGVLYLLPRVAAAMAVAAFLYRPLNILALEEESSKSLGLSLIRAKAGALAVAVSLSAFVVATVGMIGFIGLAAPALVRLAGARTLKERLVMAPLLGGGLLWLADELVQLAPLAQEIPTGIATAVLGAPLLMWMLPRLRNVSAAMWRSDISIAHRTTRPWRLVAVVVLLLALIAWPAFDLGRGPDGWRWWSIEEIARYGHWRLPRLGVATAAGIMLAIAGTLVQRLFGNPMASPEILGISSGAVLGVLLLLFIVPFPYLTMQIVAATAGAFLTLTGMLAIGKRSAFSPEHMLLLGIAISSTVGALGGIMMASNDPRFDDLFWWMSGSTNRSTGSSAMLALSVSGIALLVLPLFSRWLEILPLGETSSRALGVSLRASRFRILLFVAALTAGTTLILGPISFIGLMAPHLAKLMGLQRPLPQIYGAAAMGALLMVLADWLGRIVLYPDQIPAGLVASFVGSSYFVWLTWRRAG